MKKIVSLLLIFVMLFGMLTALTSCGAPKDNGAEINIYLGSQPFDFDPSDYYVNSNVEQVLSLIYEPLFTISKSGSLKCAAAKDYDVDKEERKITIDLRESYWSDGIIVKASDFVYAWCTRIIDSQNPNPAAALFLDIEGVEEVLNGEGNIYDVGISASEMDQITIIYREGADYKRLLKNLASIATAPVRQDKAEGYETHWSKSSPVTNGAFKVKSYDKDNGSFELARNVGYHQDPTVKDYDNKVKAGLLWGTFTVAGEEITVSYSDLKKKVTFIMSDATLAERAEYKKKAKTAEHTSVYTYVFNTSHPLFAIEGVRLALSAVIDRNEIIKAITFGKAADGFIPDVSGGAKKSFISSGANKAKAEEYLAQLTAGEKAILDANKSFTLTIDSDEESIKIAEIVEAAWESLGFNVTVEIATVVENGVENDTVVVADSEIQHLIKDAAYGDIKYDVIAVDWQTYSTDALPGLASLTSTLSGMGINHVVGDPAEGVADSYTVRKNIAAWADSEYDALVEAALACTKKKDRANKLAEAEEYLMSKMPVCPLVFNETFAFVGSKISGFKFDGLGHFTLTGVKLSGYNKYLKPEDDE